MLTEKIKYPNPKCGYRMESSYQYHKTSDTPHLGNCPNARSDYSFFTGEYCDTNDGPSLEIHLNEDGSYLMQISIFREI